MFSNLDAVKLGLRASRVTQKSVWGQLKFGPSGLANVPLMAFEASNAPKGQKIASLTGQSASLLMYPVLAGIASVGLCFIPGIGPIAASILAATLAYYPDAVLGENVSRKVRSLSEFGLKRRHLDMGGNYQDTLTAERQRLIAIQNMNAALLPGRRYLGQEALLMHR